MAALAMRSLVTASAVAALAAVAGAQELSLRRFGVRDGLALERVSALHQDRRGFLWIGTSEGLSRFDGARFVTFGAGEGLPRPQVLDIAEDPSGRLWVATNSGGVAVLDEHTARFTMHLPGPERAQGIVTTLAFAADGTLWCASEAGLHRGTEHEDGWRFTLARPGGLLVALPEPDAPWFVAHDALLETRGGALAEHASPIPPALGAPCAAAPIAPGRWVVACARGVGELELPTGAREARWTPLDLTLPPSRARAVLRDPDGTTWVASLAGLVRHRAGTSELLGVEHGLPDARIGAICRDSEGNLWIGFQLAGLARLAPGGITNVGRPSGLADPYALELLESADGRVYVTTELGGVQEIAGGRALPVPGSARVPRVGASILQARDGSWWAGDRERLLHAPGPELDLEHALELGPEHSWTPGRGAYGALAEDRDGRVWFGSFPDGVLYALALSPDGVPRATAHAGLFASPPLVRSASCDAAGRVWIGSWTGLWCVEPGAGDAGPAAREVVPLDGWPDPARNVQTVLADSRGRLWIGTRFAGLGVSDEPTAARPRFRFLTRSDGLPSDSVWALAETRDGGLVVGTGQGAALLDADGRVRERLGAAEGIGGELVSDVLCTRDGRVWLATSGGVSILDPSAPRPVLPPPPVHLERVLAGGAECMLGDGELALAPGRDRVRIDFQGIALSGERALAYEHRLVGLDDAWSAPSEARFVEYAELPPGRYRFEVRARLANGTVSRAPAVVAFRLAAPLWERPWFVASCAAAVLGLAWAAHRGRVGRALALERLRTQIAGDLHDEIGAGLAEIAVLGEVAQRSGDGARTFAAVAERARELRASMADLVWSVDPRRDRVPDLVQRLREHATRVTEGAGVELAFRAAPGLADPALALAPDRRRHVLLAFQEALQNACRHARAARVEVDLALTERALVLAVHDDGVGFDPARADGGTGLASLRRRAELLGGTLDLCSRIGAGTRVELVCPLRARRRRAAGAGRS